jgi:hypothetical protein
MNAYYNDDLAYVKSWIVSIFAFALVLGVTAVPRCEAAAASAFAPTIVNSSAAPGPAPKGMVWIPGGEFSMGAEDPRGMPGGGMQSMVDSRPIHRVYVDGFWMDATDVTNEQFAAFVKATGYVTIAERAPTRAEFPDAPAENLVAGSIVYSPTSQPVELDNYGGATSRAPIGGILKVRTVTSKAAKNIRWCRSLMTTLSHTQNGPVSDCRLRLSGSSRRVGGSQASVSSGATS